MRSLSDYLAKVPPEHAGDANFMAELSLVLQPFVDTQSLIASLPSLFDVDDAIGVQLDATGAWVGISRNIPVSVPNPWFSWGIPGLGWGQGYWQGPFEGSALTALDDTTYRRLIRAKIAANNCNGTLPAILACLTTYFDPADYPDTNIGVYDATDRNIEGLQSAAPAMGVVVSGAIPNAVDLAILGQLLIPFKPAGVTIIWGVTTIQNGPVFGFGVQNQFISGWGTGAWAATPQAAANLDHFGSYLHPVMQELLTPINPLDLGNTLGGAPQYSDDFGGLEAVQQSVDLGGVTVPANPIMQELLAPINPLNLGLAAMTPSPDLVDDFGGTEAVQQSVNLGGIP